MRKGDDDHLPLSLAANASSRCPAAVRYESRVSCQAVVCSISFACVVDGPASSFPSSFGRANVLSLSCKAPSRASGRAARWSRRTDWDRSAKVLDATSVTPRRVKGSAGLQARASVRRLDCCCEKLGAGHLLLQPCKDFCQVFDDWTAKVVAEGCAIACLKYGRLRHEGMKR